MQHEDPDKTPRFNFRLFEKQIHDTYIFTLFPVNVGRLYNVLPNIIQTSMTFKECWLDVVTMSRVHRVLLQVSAVHPAGIWCQTDVVSTSMRRHDVASTSVRRLFYVMCPLRRDFPNRLLAKEFVLLADLADAFKHMDLFL